VKWEYAVLEWRATIPDKSKPSEWKVDDELWVGGEIVAKWGKTAGTPDAEVTEQWIAAEGNGTSYPDTVSPMALLGAMGWEMIAVRETGRVMVPNYSVGVLTAPGSYSVSVEWTFKRPIADD